MKNPHFLSWFPMFHWTDPMIRVHAFDCVLALLLSQKDQFGPTTPNSSNLNEIRARTALSLD